MAFSSVAVLAWRARWLGTRVLECLEHSRLVQGYKSAPMEPMAEVAPHGANKIPAAPQGLLYVDPTGMFARAAVQSELARQWGRLSLLQFRHRRHVLDIQWQRAGAFQVWFEGWFLLEAPRRLNLLSKTLAYDKQFCLAMVQAVYCCLVPGLDVLD